MLNIHGLFDYLLTFEYAYNMLNKSAQRFHSEV